jgi:hypothetical protein
MTAEELFNKHHTEVSYSDSWVLTRPEFAKALTEDRKEIRDKINEDIKAHKHILENLENVYENKKLIEDRRLYWMGKIEALTEILTFIKEK